MHSLFYCSGGGGDDDGDDGDNNGLFASSKALEIFPS